MFKKMCVSLIPLLMAGQTMASDVDMDCKSNACVLKYSGYKDQNIELPAGINSLQIRYSGSGDLTIEGNVGDIELRSKGSGDLDLRDLRAKTIDLDHSGSGAVYLNAVDTVAGFNDGSGKIVIAGGARVALEGSGSGRIYER